SLQGRKILRGGNQAYTIGAGEMAVYATSLPIATEVLEASPDKPYLALSLPLDYDEIERLAVKIRPLPPPNEQKTAPIPTALFNSLERLIDLLDSPNHQQVLFPLLQTEIYFYLLQSNLGGSLHRHFQRGQSLHRIGQAVNFLQQHFAEHLEMENLAAQMGMSGSNFYRRFREITGLSPLQYQKNLRLLAARKLVKQRQLGITAVAYEVGYESPSQFSREYKQFFGISPKADG
ncbi:AraC-like DNA-binding protein, partial [Neisseria perflava]